MLPEEGLLFGKPQSVVLFGLLSADVWADKLERSQVQC